MATTEEGSLIEKSLALLKNTSLPLPQQARIASFVLSPAIESFLDDDGLATIAEVAEMPHDMVGELTPLQYGMGAAIVQSLPREQIKGKLKEIFASVTYDKALENAKQTRAMYKSMTQKDHIALSKTINAILPPGLKTFFKVVRNEPVGESVEAGVKRVRAQYRTMTDAQIAQEAVEKSARLPLEEVTDAVQGVLQNVTPAALKTLAETFTAAVTPEDLTILGQSGALLVNTIAKALVNGENLIKVGRASEHGGDFADSLKKVLAGLEDAVVASGITSGADKIVTAISASKQKLALG